MAQHGLPWTLTSRNGVYYCKLEGTTARVSLGTKNMAMAKRLAKELWDQKCQQPSGSERTLWEALEPYYTDKCPHYKRIISEGRTIGKGYLKESRSLLVTHIKDDAIAKIKLKDLKRKDLLDFQARLVGTIGLSKTANEALARLKTSLKELYFREEIDRDLTVGVGTIKHEAQVRERFTTKELEALFSERPGPWESGLAYDVFILAASTGMRRGEILALHWEDVDLHQNLIYVRKALKDAGQGNIIGTPKWGKKRITPLLPQAREAILRQGKGGRLVFSKLDGELLGINWWRKSFNNAVMKAGISRKGLVPHSFRHTINSVWRGAGIPDSTIRSVLGWSSTEVQDNYTHISVDEMSKLPGI